MQISSQAEVTISFSEDLGQQISSRLLEKIKKYSKARYQRGIYTGGRIFLNLSADEELSPHIVSLIKRVSEVLKDYRIGVRDYYVPSYEITFESDHVGTLEIPHTKAVICNGKTCRVAFQDLEKDFLKNGGVGRIVNLIETKTQEKSWKVVQKSEGTLESGPNPYEEIEQTRLAKKGISKGEYFYRPEGLKKIRKIKKQVMSLLEDFGLEEYFPTSYTNFRILEKKGLMELMPPEAFALLASEATNKGEAYESYYLRGKVPPIPQKPKGIVYNDIPFHLYGALEKLTIKNPHHLYAIQNAQLRITFFTPNKAYSKTKEEYIKKITELPQSLGLNFRIISRPVQGEIFRAEAYLPHNKSWLIICEAMFSEDNYTNPFKIKGKSGQVNINLENILLAQIAQKKNESSVPSKEAPEEIREPPEFQKEPNPIPKTTERQIPLMEANTDTFERELEKIDKALTPSHETGDEIPEEKKGKSQS